MAVKGVFSSDQNIAGTTKGSFASAILELYPTGSAQLLALTSGMQSSDESSTITTWFEENHLAGYLKITNNAAVGVTIVLDDASEVVPFTNMLIQSTGEYVYVENVVGETLTVIRGFADSTITAIDGSVTPVPVQRISTAREEGSDKPISIANIGYPRFNYMQIFRNSWDATRTAKSVAYHTGDVVAKNRAFAGIAHAEDIERSIIWGRRAIGVQNGKRFSTMNGVTNQIVTNVTAQGANTSWDDINNFLQVIFEKNIKGKPNERIAYCGNTVLSVLNKIAVLNSQIHIMPGETEFGLKVNKWLTPFGDITLMTHPLMNENPVWTKEMYILHPGAIKMKYLDRTSHDANDRDGTRAGVDADFGVYTTECTVEYGAELTGGIYTGMDTAVA